VVLIILIFKKDGDLCILTILTWLDWDNIEIDRHIFVNLTDIE